MLLDFILKTNYCVFQDTLCLLSLPSPAPVRLMEQTQFIDWLL